MNQAASHLERRGELQGAQQKEGFERHREGIKKEEERHFSAKNALFRQGCLPKGSRRGYHYIPSIDLKFHVGWLNMAFLVGRGRGDCGWVRY